MSDLDKIQEQHSAGPQLIGFDYQFYYFISLLLDLDHGQKIGYEVKDDVHIDKPDGVTVLYQTKHTTSLKANGEPENLTDLDGDLWKTLSNWVDMAKTDNSILENYSFQLVTNKSEGKNSFIDALENYHQNKKIEKVIAVVTELKDKTADKNLKSFIENVLSLDETSYIKFFSRLRVITGIDDVIEEIKSKIFKNVRNQDFVIPIYESLYANMHEAKYLEIKKGEKFEISFEDFNLRFGKCFRVAFKDKPLPKRTFPISLPDNLEEQTFIRQLIDIGELENGSDQIVIYTTQMLQAANLLTYWSDNSFVLPTEMDEFNTNTTGKWRNEFRAKYRAIEKRIKAGTSVKDLEAEIQELGLQLLDFMRKVDLQMVDHILGVEFSNGHYYSLADKPEIGWHFDWEKKYKKV